MTGELKSPGYERPGLHEDDCLPQQSGNDYSSLNRYSKRQLTPAGKGGYARLTAAPAADRFGDRKSQRRISAIRALFSCSSYGGVRWETSGSAGFLCGRFANPMHAATLKAIKVAVSQPTEETMS